MNTAADLYVECCQRFGVKPNGEIEAQVTSTDFLHVCLIDASHTFLGRLGVRAVLAFVRQHQCVTEVRIPQNNVDEACMGLLADIITEGHPSLQRVDLSRNPLSTPAIRRIWAAARVNTRFQHLQLDDCGVPVEWVTRLQSTLRANQEMEELGYEPYGIPRSPQSWHTVFILMLGTPEAVQDYSEKCLPAVNNYLAALRVRVAALSLNEADSADQVASKLARCQDPFNHDLIWCVTLLGLEPLSKRNQFALGRVLRQRPPANLPLHDKLGQVRPRCYRSSRALFCYTPVSWEMSNGVSDVVPASQWLRSAGFAGSPLYDSLAASVTLPAVVLTPGNTVARWQSDLFTSLQLTFREPPEDETQSTFLHTDAVLQMPGSRAFYTSADEVEMLRRFVPAGRLHPKKTTLILQYVSGPYRDSGSPFIFYGAESIGKGNILCNVASLLWEGRCSAGGEVPTRVVCYIVDVQLNSLVVFLYRLLHLFAPDSTLEFTSIEALADAVRESIRAYKGSTLALMLGRIDLLDTCGCHCSMLAAWMPNILPASVRIVVSLDTESPVLPLLRNRMPQPFECLCPPMTELNSVQLFKSLLKDNNTVLPGMDCSEEPMSREALGTCEKCYLQKEEAMTVLYPRLAASYVHHLLNTGRRVDSDYETQQLIEGALPATVEELLTSLHDKASVLHPKITVETLLVLIALAPLPASELVYLCEELGPCPRHTALSALLLLSDMGLVLWYQDETAHVAHPILRQLYLRLCSEHVPKLSVLVESHLYRLVITYSTEVPLALWHLLPLMMENGNVRQAAQLLRDPVWMDAVVQRGPLHRLHVLDGFLRLLQARNMLRELASIGGPQVPAVMAEGPLMTCLREVAHYSSDLFQTALLRRSYSPYTSVEAISHCITPQLFVQPLNNGSECTAVASAHMSESCSWCHCRGDCVVCATSDSVFVYASTLGKPIAELHMPFERQQRITGVLLAAGTRVLVASETQVLVWDYEGNSHFLFADMRIGVRPANLDAFGAVLVATSTATNLLCLVDVLKKRIVRELPDVEEGVRQYGCFCGNHLLLLSHSRVCLYDEEMKNYVTFVHDSFVVGVTCNRDGRVLVSCSSVYLHVWTSTGELLHRVDIGPDPLVRLRVSASGAHFVTMQSNTLQVWRTLTGTPTCTLHNPFSEDTNIEHFVFTEDSAKVVARAGPYIMVWDTFRGQLMGAESAPVGLIRHIAVHETSVFAATTKGDLLDWSLERGLSSIEQIKEGQRTSNLLCNGKVSSQPVRSISTHCSGGWIVTVDGAHVPRLYSLTSGVPLAHSMGRVRSAVAVNSTAVAFLPLDSNSLCFFHPGDESHQDARPLPKTVLPEAKCWLCVSPDERYVAVVVSQLNRSHTLIYPVEAGEPLWCQLQGHTGRTLEINFFGSFVYTVGEHDNSVRLWNLARKVERTSYTHHCPLLAATGNGAGVLFCVDAEGAVLRIHVDNIVSVKNAMLVVTRLPLHTAIPSIQAATPRSMCLYENYLILVTASGELLLIDTLRDSVGHRVAFRDCLCTCVGILKDAPALFTGHTSGTVLINSLMLTGIKGRGRRT